jgi:hypothetical protein
MPTELELVADYRVLRYATKWTFKLGAKINGAKINGHQPDIIGLISKAAIANFFAHKIAVVVQYSLNAETFYHPLGTSTTLW